MPAERPTSYDEENDEHRVTGLTSPPAVYRDPDDPEYDKPFTDPDDQVHTIIPGSVPAPAVAHSGADLGDAQPAPLTDYPAATGAVPGHAASPPPGDTPAADDDSGTVPAPDGDPDTTATAGHYDGEADA